MNATQNRNAAPADAPGLFQRKGVVVTMAAVSVLSIAAILWAASLTVGQDDGKVLDRPGAEQGAPKVGPDGQPMAKPGSTTDPNDPFKPAWRAGPSAPVKVDKTLAPPPKGEKGASY